MGTLYNIKNKEFIVYHLTLDNYIGVTTNLQKRLWKHSSKSGFCVDNDVVNILYVTNDLREALDKELEFQKIYKCTKGIRNQEGSKNPYAKEVLDLSSGIFYDTIKEACNALQFNYSLVRKMIKNDNNKFNLKRF